MVKVKVMVREDWVPAGRMYVIDAIEMDLATLLPKMESKPGDPQKILIVGSDADALRVKLAVEDANHTELVE